MFYNICKYASQVSSSSSSSSSSSLARQPFVSPGLPQNYSPFFPIVGLSGYSFFGFLNNLIFMVWGCQPHIQPPTWRTRVFLFVWLLPLDLSSLSGATSKYATAGIALRVSGALKPHHHDKVGTASVGNKWNQPKIYWMLEMMPFFSLDSWYLCTSLHSHI
jgi:hypothetical protein